MKVIKPLKLGLLQRTFEHDAQVYLSVSIYVFFNFEEPNHPLPEVAMWKMLGEELGTAGDESAVFDEGMPKPGSEVLVRATAHAPGGEPRPAFKVSLELGALEKTLYVVGNRYWVRGAATDPEPITQMPLDWQHAFGGAGFAPNPLGRGMTKVADAAGELRLPLPNIEDPQRLLQSPDDRPTPAGFGSLSVAWPQRQTFRGTYDDAWLEEVYPGYPRDFDVRFFHQAVDDQRLERFEGGERFALVHMHPEHERVEGTLPTLTTRCFVGLDHSSELTELSMRPETVQLFPHLTQGVLIYRGTLKIREDDARDVTHLMIAAEDRDAPKPRSHYTKVFGQRTDPERSHYHLLRDEDLLPPLAGATSALEPDPLLAGERLVETNVRRGLADKLAETRRDLEDKGIDPDEHGVPKELPEAAELNLATLEDQVEAAKKEAKQRQEQAEQKAEEEQQRAREAAERHGLDYDELVKKARAQAAGPPAFRAENELSKLQQELQLSRNTGVELPAVAQQLSDPDVFVKLQRIEARLVDVYRRFAQHFPAAASLEGEEATRVRAEVERRISTGESFDKCDLTGGDLSHLSLAGADLSGAFMEAANLRGADLSGANLTKAVFTRANLSGAKLGGCQLAGANLAAATLTDADLRGADLTEANLERTRLRGVDLSTAKLDRTWFTEADVAGSTWQGVRATELLFIDNDLSDVSFVGAHLSACNFINVVVDRCDWSSAELPKCMFLGACGVQNHFDGANLAGLRLVKSCNFAEGTFTDAVLDGANVRGSSFEGADFSGASLEGADFSECGLHAAKLERARARNSSWIRADLSLANLTGMDALLAVMAKADLRGAKLVGTNLVRADLARIHIDDDTSFEGALLDQARRVKRRPAPEESHDAG